MKTLPMEVLDESHYGDLGDLGSTTLGREVTAITLQDQVREKLRQGEVMTGWRSDRKVEIGWRSDEWVEKGWKSGERMEK
ncbi:hypothetical protein Pcinc_036914 [Petrolisthes cinctipes]|uniref:Uncharacterized protein n=1 Tax=Petrolisthes cinctipes TaxID=88211 RepID=A0AAE1EN65_PETCI|nr:hypothetical protein Pcinc_036914 [Petrolisthes cinctipes]